MTFEWILIVIVLVNAAATITLWQTAARRPEKLKKKFLKRLRHSKPITPKHQPSATIDDKPLITDRHRRFFNDFEDFADVVNRWLADPNVGSSWRLQELPDVELSLHGVFDHGPTYGRRYAIFYNQVRLGTLEVSGFLYGGEHQSIVAEIELNYARLLSFNTILGFLTSIALHICDPRPDSKEQFKAQQQIDRAMAAVLWQTIEVSEFETLPPDYAQIEVRLDGSAEWYFDRRDCDAFRSLAHPAHVNRDAQVT